MRTRIATAREDRDQGFTLIELLVVVIIIGILAAIAIPVFLNQRKKGVDASIKSDLKNAATVAETITTDNPASTTAFSQTTLEAADWKHDANTVFTVTGQPSLGNFCISGYNTGGTANATGSQFKYDALAGGLRGTTGAGC